MARVFRVVDRSCRENCGAGARFAVLLALGCGLSLPVAAQRAAETAALTSPQRGGDSGHTRASAYDDLVREALLEVDAEHWPEAHALFQRAHEIDPNARTLRGLGVTAFELRHYADAVRDLSAALADTRNPLPADLRAEVEGALERARRFVGMLRIQVEPQDATVHIDGDDVREREVVLDAGEYTLSVTADDYRRESVTVRVSGGELRTVSVQLIRLDVTPQRVRLESSGRQLATPSDRATRSILETWWFWTLAGAVAVGATVAIVVATQRADAPGEQGIGGVHQALVRAQFAVRRKGSDVVRR
jgi:hypothetical protein